MDKVPPEICTKIFSHACLDSGKTGRSLSLVSKFVRETSQTVKLQSISLHGRDQMLAFSSLLKRTPPPLRRVRYLFISSRDPDLFTDKTDEPQRQQPPTDENNGHPQNKTDSSSVLVTKQQALVAKLFRRRAVTLADDAEEREKQMARAVQSILMDIAESLKILEVAFSHHISADIDVMHPISLPNLEELTTHDGFPLARDGLTTCFEPCHRLRRLHIAQCYTVDLFGGIAQLAPSLTHLRFSGLQQETWFEADLAVALGIRQETPGETWKPPVTKLPLTVQKVLVQPAPHPPRGGFCGTPTMSYASLLRHLNSLNEIEDRFILLKAQEEWTPSRCIDDKSDWLNRVAGGEGCWSINDMIPKTREVRKALNSGALTVENSRTW